MDSVELIRNLCKERGIAISQLEKDCGFSNGYIRGLRRGILPSDRAKIVADYFDISINYLLSGGNDESEPSNIGLYEQIRKAAKEKGYSINRLEKELGFARSSINKFNKNTPSMDKIQQIADLLGVSVDSLLHEDEIPESKEGVLNHKDELDIEKRLESTLADLENDQSALMFSGNPLDDKTRDLLKISLENSIRIAKINAKKYTNKRYKNTDESESN